MLLTAAPIYEKGLMNAKIKTANMKYMSAVYIGGPLGSRTQHQRIMSSLTRFFVRLFPLYSIIYFL